MTPFVCWRIMRSGGCLCVLFECLRLTLKFPLFTSSDKTIKSMTREDRDPQRSNPSSFTRPKDWTLELELELCVLHQIERSVPILVDWMNRNWVHVAPSQISFNHLTFVSRSYTSLGAITKVPASFSSSLNPVHALLKQLRIPARDRVCGKGY